MGFFDKLGEAAQKVGEKTGELAQKVGEKTEETIEIGKLNGDISKQKGIIRKEQSELGKKIYEAKQNNEDYIPIVEGMLAAIENCNDEIERLQGEIERIREEAQVKREQVQQEKVRRKEEQAFQTAADETVTTVESRPVEETMKDNEASEDVSMGEKEIPQPIQPVATQEVEQEAEMKNPAESNSGSFIPKRG